MPFGLSNAPSTLMRLMNEVLKPFIGKFDVVYLDDIPFFSKSKEEHLRNIEMVLRRLHEEKLMINFEKCDFMKEELVYLGFFISKGSLKMDPSKVDAILSWPTPKSIGDVRSFNGLVSFYRKFINNFSHICAPILDTIKGGNKGKFSWTNEADKGFGYLKKRVSQKLILVLPNFEKVLPLSVMLVTRK